MVASTDNGKAAGQPQPGASDRARSVREAAAAPVGWVQGLACEHGVSWWAGGGDGVS